MQVDTAGGKSAERHIPRLRPVQRDEQIERLPAEGAGAGQSRPGDDGRGVSPAHLLNYRRGLRQVADVTEEPVDVAQAGTRDDPLHADPAMFGAQVQEQFRLQFSAGAEVGMPPLAGEGTMGSAVPVCKSLTRAGSGRDHGDGAGGVGNTPVEECEIFSPEKIDAAGVW